MAVLAGLVGAIAGFTVGVVFTEVVFANNAEWANVVPIVLAVAGWLGARELLRQRRSRKPERHMHSASG
jgi:hypothetical protein